MTARIALSNIASFGLQITILVAAGAALARAFRIDQPRAMLAYWRTILLACLVLPLCQPWIIVIPPTLTSTTVVASSNVAPAVGEAVSVVSRSAAWKISDLVLLVLAAGTAARTLWLTIGAFGLRRLRRDATPLEPVPDCVRHAQERIGTRADIYISDRVSGPITFGLRRPIVLFPPSVTTMPAHVQEAIACHELLHVRRRDWLCEILEEAVRSVLWFHPAIWWLIGRIQLTREQVVDQAAIQLTNSRERYVESLLTVALAGSPAAFTPASPFLRRHLLKKRVARILKETTMTTRHLIGSLTVSAAALTLATTLAVRAFPLEAQGRAPTDSGEPIQLVAGGEHLMHGERPDYPRRAIEQKVEGDVIVEMTLNDRGEVSDARVVSGPEELRKATLEAVLQWHYSPSAIRSTVTQATLRFHLPAAGLEKAKLAGQIVLAERLDDKAHGWALASPGRAEGGLMEIDPEPMLTDLARAELKAKHLEMMMIHTDNLNQVDLKLHEAEIGDQPWSHKLKHELLDDLTVKLVKPDIHLQPKFEGTPRLVDVRAERVSDATAKELLAQAGVAIGDSITEETAKRIAQVARDMDEHFRVEFHRSRDELIVTILAR